MAALVESRPFSRRRRISTRGIPKGRTVFPGRGVRTIPTSARRAIRAKPGKMFREFFLDRPRQRYTIRVQYFSNGEQRWVKLTIDDKLDRKPPATVRLNSEQYNQWLKKRKRSGGDEKMLISAASQMVAHPDMVKTVLQHGSAVAGSGVGELIKMILDAS